jgi:hypothetical protein
MEVRLLGRYWRGRLYKACHTIGVKVIFLGDDENQTDGEEPKLSECKVCVAGLVEYIQEDFCRGADGEDLCRTEAGQLASKLIDGEITENQFANDTVNLMEKYFGKVMVRKDGNEQRGEGSS